MKPVKWGVRWFTIVEPATGYVLGLLPYTGKRADTAFGKTTEMVLWMHTHQLEINLLFKLV